MRRASDLTEELYRFGGRPYTSPGIELLDASHPKTLDNGAVILSGGQRSTEIRCIIHITAKSTKGTRFRGGTRSSFCPFIQSFAAG